MNHLTIGQLKSYLAEMEAEWTDEDTYHLGRFEDQPVYTDSEDGLCQTQVSFTMEMGLLVIPLNPQAPEHNY